MVPGWSDGRHVLMPFINDPFPWACAACGEDLEGMALPLVSSARTGVCAFDGPLTSLRG